MAELAWVAVHPEWFRSDSGRFEYWYLSHLGAFVCYDFDRPAKTYGTGEVCRAWCADRARDAGRAK